MIAKHVPMKAIGRSNFAGLVTYLTGTQGKEERVGQVTVSNCGSDEVDDAILEVLNTQALNTRAMADKTYHLIVSFRDGEEPDAQALRAIEEALCAGIGFAEHQRISVVHYDTDHLHLHIAINKIHPQHHTIHEPFNAYYVLGGLCMELEQRFELAQDNHRPAKNQAENRADDMERQAGVESLIGWIKRECAGEIKAAQSWADLHKLLQKHGLTLHERGNGLVFTSDTGSSVKASSVDRALSKPRLEARMGQFIAGEARKPDKPVKAYSRQPMRSKVDTSALYARYTREQRQSFATHACEWEKAVARKKRLIEDAKRTARLKRAAIKLLRAGPVARKVLYGTTSTALRHTIDNICKDYLRDRQEIHQRCQRRSWADWLRSAASNGDAVALAALRERSGSIPVKTNSISGQGSPAECPAAARPDSVTKNGTIIYSTVDGAIRDDGRRLSVSLGAGRESLQAALRLAVERYGGCIAVNGSASFKEQIASAAAGCNVSFRFDDAMLEQRRRQLQTAARAGAMAQAVHNLHRPHRNSIQ